MRLHRVNLIDTEAKKKTKLQEKIKTEYFSLIQGGLLFESRSVLEVHEQ